MEWPQDVQHTVYVFDGFHLDVTRRKLISSGGLVRPLKARAMDALLLLVANAGQTVEKRLLMETVWPSAIVEDNNLNQCVLAIRKALGEAAGSNRYVMTVPGRGYRFVCPVREMTQESLTELDVGDKSTRRMPAALWLGVVLVLWMTAMLLMSAGRQDACAVYSTGTSTDELLPSQHFT
jgi:DNA-binding winged helix-turn-helix (wHTH) protein